MRIPPVGLLLSLASLAAAMDEGYSRHSEYLGGYRFGVGAAPGLNNHKASGSTDATGVADPTQDVEVKLDEPYGTDLYGGMFFNTALDGGWGVAFAPSIFYRDTRGRRDKGGFAVRDELKAWGVRFAVGPALGIGPLQLELTPYLSVGQAWMQTEYTSAGVSTRRGSGGDVLFDYGVQANAYWLFASNVYLGVSAGYDSYESKLDSPAAGALDKQTITVKGSGPTIGGMFGFWF